MKYFHFSFGKCLYTFNSFVQERNQKLNSREKFEGKVACDI